MRLRFLTLIAIPLLAQSAIFSAETQADSGIELMRRLDNATVQVFEKVAPAVVIVEADKKKPEDEEGGLKGFDFFFQGPDGDDAKRRFHLPRKADRSEGSGFIVRGNGFILTNNHVIEDADKIEVKLRDGRHFVAKVVGQDEKTDIAVLKIEASGLPVAPLADSDAVRVGQMCFAIGIPYNLDYSFSAGHVSAKGRNALASSSAKPMYEDYIQTDAFINPGNSGGPLFDIEGRVIGMNTLINGIGRGLSFAIPSNMLRETGDQLIATGKISRPWLGIQIETLGEESELAEHLKGIEKGVVVVAIEPDAPVYKSDLRPADVITAVDGVEVATAHALQKEVLKKKIGQTVELAVWRNGKTLKMPVATGEIPVGPGKVSQETAPKQEGAPVAGLFGLQLQDLTRELAGQFKLNTSTGVVVTDVAQGSPAAEADLQRGDVITEIDEKPVADTAMARKLLDNHEGSRGVLLFIERKGQKTYTVLKPQK